MLTTSRSRDTALSHPSKRVTAVRPQTDAAPPEPPSGPAANAKDERTRSSHDITARAAADSLSRSALAHDPVGEPLRPALALRLCLRHPRLAHATACASRDAGSSAEERPEPDPLPLQGPPTPPTQAHPDPIFHRDHNLRRHRAAEARDPGPRHMIRDANRAHRLAPVEDARPHSCREYAAFARSADAGNPDQIAVADSSPSDQRPRATCPIRSCP